MTTLGASLRFDHRFLAVEQAQRIHCMLELTAPPIPDDRRRPPLHLALVLDRSGSMGGAPLETAKRAAAYLVHRLRSDDQLSVVAYDGDVTLVHGLAPVGVDQQLIEHQIAGSWPGGATNLSGGWLKGVEQLRAVPGGTGPKKVVLLSDGHANQGIDDAGELAKLARGAADDGISTTTIGFGAGFDENLMTAMANEGGGNAFFAPGVDDVPGIFAQEFEDLVALVAQNLSVEIRPDTDAVSVVSVLNEYPTTAVPGGVQVQVGDAYGEERRRIVFALDVPSLPTLGPANVAEVVVRYVSIGDEVAAHKVRVPVAVNLVAADDPAAAELDTEVTEEVVILASARAQDEARERAERGDFDGAQDILKRAADDLRAIAPNSKRAEELLEQAEQTEAHGRAMEGGMFDALSAKQMRYQSNIKRRERRKGPE
jgi:Ca-activated chloride channel family protein